ncbi:MAG: DUF3134 family protein [Coleofasciculus sp. C1-SOL-03]|jgi:hypothetical protein|uniref:DUF3134 family protein n=1 Tax=Coleofasciculus sp. C1-SOL-03 TaxID=3069522 RepID=UPI0032FAA6DA
MYNPSLREESREQLAPVISVPRETSVLEWLETTNRLLARDPSESDIDDDEEEISELMGVDDNDYEDEEDDDLDE